MYSLRDLQLLVEAQYSVEDTRKDLNEMVEFFRALPNQKEVIEVIMQEERKIPVSIAEEQKVFFVDEDTTLLDIPEKFRSESLGMVNKGFIVYSGRLVYPVFDVRGDVMGFCGWDKYVKPKYLDSRNHGYKAKETTFYGMEKLGEYYRSGKPVYVVEGIVCCLYLRSIGLQAIALLGSSLTKYVTTVLRRFDKRLIVIPDNDAYGKSVEELGGSLAGEHFVKQAKRLLPNATVIQSVIAKDIDDSRLMKDKEQTLIRELGMVAVNPYMPFTTIRVR